jgi:hypothetical protein
VETTTNVNDVYQWLGVDVGTSNLSGDSREDQASSNKSNRNGTLVRSDMISFLNRTREEKTE